MKKRMAVILSFLLLVFLASTTMCFAGEEQSLKDNFNSYVSSTAEGLWMGNIPVVTTDKGKSAIIGNGNGVNLYFKHTGFSADVKGVIAQFSIRLNNTISQPVIFGSGSDKTGVDGNCRMLQFHSTGYLQALAGAVAIPISYSADTWYDIRVEINYETGYYRLNMTDGVTDKFFETTNDGFKRTDLQKSAAVYYSFWIASNTAAESVNIDNVNIFATTDDRIYPTYKEEYDFSNYSSINGTTAPNSWTVSGASGAALGVAAEVVSIDKGVSIKAVSDGSSELCLYKSFGRYIKSASVKADVRPSDGCNAILGISDSLSNTESPIKFENGNILIFGECVAPFTANTWYGVSINLKSGICYAKVYNDTALYCKNSETGLSDAAKFSVTVPKGSSSCFYLDNAIFKTIDFLMLNNSNIKDGAENIAPDTNEIVLKFSNKIILPANTNFNLSGDRSIESISSDGKEVTLHLNDTLSPNKSYNLTYSDLFDDEVGVISGGISFKTLDVLSVTGVEVSALGSYLVANADMKSNVSDAQDVLLIITAYDKVTGQIKAANFEKISVTVTQNPYSVTINTDGINLAECTVEVYIWNNFGGMKSLNGISCYQGGES